MEVRAMLRHLWQFNWIFCRMNQVRAITSSPTVYALSALSESVSLAAAAPGESLFQKPENQRGGNPLILRTRLGPLMPFDPFDNH